MAWRKHRVTAMAAWRRVKAAKGESAKKRKEEAAAGGRRQAGINGESRRNAAEGSMTATRKRQIKEKKA